MVATAANKFSASADDKRQRAITASGAPLEATTNFDDIRGFQTCDMANKPVVSGYSRIISQSPFPVSAHPARSAMLRIPMSIGSNESDRLASAPDFSKSWNSPG